jgi:uncharacterized protein YidB (DUF937 family)
MGLFDAIAGALGGQAGQQSPLINIAMQMMQGQGGLSGLVEKLTQGGLGSQVSSWVGTGANQSVSGDQISNALGGDQIKEIAAKLGIPADQAAGGLAQVLPHLIDHLTPGGQVPASNDAVQVALSALKAKLGV